MLRKPTHRPNHPVSDALSEDLSPHFEPDHSRRAILGILEDYSIYSSNFAAFTVDELFVENVTDNVHHPPPMN
jgi:hypothetical protein